MRKTRSRSPQTILTGRFTSQPGVVKNSHKPLEIQAQSLLVGMLSGRTVKAWRNAKDLGAAKLGEMLGYSRSYVKAIEGGSLPVSAKFASKFRELQQSINGHVFEPEPPKPCTLTSRYEIPATIEILAKPVKCRGCGKWILPRSPNQKTHTSKACQRKAARNARRRRVKRMRGHRLQAARSKSVRVKARMK